MKKKIIALAVAGALAAPLAAQAEVTVYGKAHLSLDSVKVEDQAGNTVTDDYELTSRASRVGVKGSEDLGNGLKAIYGMEWEVSLDENDGINKGRNAFIGLSGGFGTVLAGKHDTPFKMSTAKLDMFTDEAGDYNPTVGFDDQRANNAIAYVSPSFSGLTIAAAVIPGETTDTADGIADASSVAGMYSAGPLFVAVAYESLPQDFLNAAFGTTNFQDDYTKVRVGVGYGMAGMKFAVIAEQQDFGTYDLSGYTPAAGTSVSMDRTLVQVQAGYTMGANTFKAMYGMADDMGDFKDSGRSTFALGVDHAFSKTTKVYAEYADVNGDDAAIGNTSAMVSTVTSMDLTKAGLNDSKVFSLGMVTKF